jgi:hypothetical protein
MADNITNRTCSSVDLSGTNSTLTTENENEFEVIQLDTETCPETVSEPNFKDRLTLQRLKKTVSTLLLPNSRQSSPDRKEQRQENKAKSAAQCNSREKQSLLQRILQKIVKIMQWMCRHKSLELNEQELENCIESASEPSPAGRLPHNAATDIQNEHA